LEGSLVTIFCERLDGVEDAAVNKFPLPDSLSGVTVTLDGVNLPLLAVAKFRGHQQINAQVPRFSAPDGVSMVVAVNYWGSSGTLRVPFRGVPLTGDLFRDPEGNGDFFRAD